MPGCRNPAGPMRTSDPRGNLLHLHGVPIERQGRRANFNWYVQTVHFRAHVSQLRRPQREGNRKSLPWTGKVHIQLSRTFRRRGPHGQAQQGFQTTQVFEFRVAAQKQTIAGSKYPTASIQWRGCIHRHGGRADSQVSFGGPTDLGFFLEGWTLLAHGGGGGHTSW